MQVYEKLDPSQKDNYTQVSLLSNALKTFERIIYQDFNKYMEDKMSTLITSYKKLHRAQHSLIIMLKNGNKLLIKKNISL